MTSGWAWESPVEREITLAVFIVRRSVSSGGQLCRGIGGNLRVEYSTDLRKSDWVFEY